MSWGTVLPATPKENVCTGSEFLILNELNLGALLASCDYFTVVPLVAMPIKMTGGWQKKMATGAYLRCLFYSDLTL